MTNPSQLVAQMKGKEAQASAQQPPDVAGLSLTDSGRDDEDDDPFGDSNVVETPAVERREPRW